jgi:hypothetical protein
MVPDMPLRFLTPFLLFCAIHLASCSAVPMPPAENTTTPLHTVERIYRDFAAEAVLESPVQPGLWHAPLETWRMYFSKKIIRLYASVIQCNKKEGGLCTTELSPIWYSMDPAGVTVSIESSSQSTVIATVTFPKDALDSRPATLKYHLISEDHDWKIDDITYDNGTTLQKWLTEFVHD